ncbi:hypothetical protein SLEP1_g26126 [Rubroshorea leprosula]|uniref:Uncharacterized protein n=1 Tax=Rubroshorea leprosula TaxID=152421 RepID=A0AAV5JVD2_9ROSI|nr:hypothetical protein SLEP1_g26126 [Rubroshorea leprosula]
MPLLAAPHTRACPATAPRPCRLQPPRPEPSCPYRASLPLDQIPSPLRPDPPSAALLHPSLHSTAPPSSCTQPFFQHQPCSVPVPARCVTPLASACLSLHSPLYAPDPAITPLLLARLILLLHRACTPARYSTCQLKSSSLLIDRSKSFYLFFCYLGIYIWKKIRRRGGWLESF